ncbi:hypothetical protein [Burkholderia stabilis]|uniref:hypothetical protein n=1 Tax=Burkholderia stabilis TaxID=95485 RepID=UPI00158A7C14|nr:hypothetical protein [Burkholderia stabilis]
MPIVPWENDFYSKVVHGQRARPATGYCPLASAASAMQTMLLDAMMTALPCPKKPAHWPLLRFPGFGANVLIFYIEQTIQTRRETKVPDE